MKGQIHVAILAAGMGTRMHSTKPKVLHSVLFRPMISYALDLGRGLNPDSISVVVGHEAESIQSALANNTDLQFAIQEPQLGTAHAVQMLKPTLGKKTGAVVVLCGDVIALQPATLKEMLNEHLKSKACATLLTAVVDPPCGYGRILRDAKGGVRAVREDKDCETEEKLIKEINSGIYIFEISALFEALERVQNKNAQAEYYLPDVVEIFLSESKPVNAFQATPMEVAGINDRADLVGVEREIQRRVNEFWLKKGVKISDPESTRICVQSTIGKDVEIESGSTIIASKLGENVVVESGCRIMNSSVAEGVRLKQGCYLEESEVGEHSILGPYAHLRPGAKLGAKVKIGNFVELKKVEMGAGSKASHLSYIGDAKIGKDVNLGCGFITCNYDGKNKHVTIIEDGVFVGSDSQTVAPVTLKKGSYVASGTTVTEDVPEESLVISRGRQITKVGYLKKRE